MALTRITSDGITDAAIVNADINASAAIAGSKIDPDFGSQTLTTAGKLLITQNTTSIPEIELNGQGPNFIRFTDSQVATGSLDLIFRDSPNTLGIEKSSDGTSLFTVDCDDGLVTVANDLKVEGDILLLSDGSNPVLRIDGSGPNFITFASDSSGTVDADSINLVYRTSPNTLGFERASDATALFTIDADDGQATFPFNLAASSLTIDTNTLHVDASNNRVGIGTTSPAVKFVVSNGGAEGLEVSHSSGNVELNAYNRSTSARSPVGIVGQTFTVTTGNPTLNTGLFQNSSGNVGIGTSSPTYKLHLTRTDAAGNYAYLGASSDGGQRGLEFTSSDSGIFLGAIHTINAVSGAGQIAFATASSERMRIDSSGNALIGRTSTINGNQNTSTGTHINSNGLFQCAVDGDTCLALQRLNSNGSIIQFRRNTTFVGGIEVTTSSTAYNTSGSDRTLKKNFELWNENVLDLFKSINPQKFNFIQEDDGAEKSKGFVAQDMVSSFPEAYTKGEEEDSKYFFNPSGMVVYLMKALQEAVARIEALEAK